MALANKIVKKMELSAVLGMVRQELIKANDAAFAAGNPVMVFDECEVEFGVSLEEDIGVGFKLYFVELSAKQKKSDSNTVKVKYRALEARGLVAAAGSFNVAADMPKRQTKPKE
jgi:hypothetical protein